MQWLIEDDFAKFPSWSGARETVATISHAGKFDELSQLMEEITDPNTCGKIWTDTEINDFLWFESSYIFEQLNLSPEGEDIEELWDNNNDQLEEIFATIEKHLSFLNLKLTYDVEELYIEWIGEKDAPLGTTIILPDIYNYDYKDRIVVLEWAENFLKIDPQLLVTEFINYCHECEYFITNEKETENEE